MAMPILDFEDGYGFAYGVRLALPDSAGAHSRLSVPATWGGDKRLGVELEKTVEHIALTRVQGGAVLSRREHPFFEQPDDRGRVFVRGERDFGRWLRGGVTGARERVSFLNERDDFTQYGADVVLDTRIDPMLARNALYARASWDRLRFRTEPAMRRTELEARAYVGVVGQSVLVIRALKQDANRPRPQYLKPILGGALNLRGFKAGTAVGDTLVAASAELRVPLTSPLSLGKLGVSGFVDMATVYDEGSRFRDQELRRGAGVGVWFAAAVVRLNVSLAHGIGGTTRAHFGTSVVF
jgi:outer membrane protein assembly factor BamA